MIEMIILIGKSIKGVLDASVPVLYATLGGITLLWVIVAIKQAKPFEKEIACFRRLTLINKITLIALLCSFTWWGGAKENGNRGNSGDAGRNTMSKRETGSGQMRSLPPELLGNTNLLEVAAFEISVMNEVVAFEMSWATNLFDYADSRGLYLFASTNLSDNVWFPMGLYLMPEGTNAHAFVVSVNNVESSMRQWFRETFGGIGFYRFGIDFDSDGDGIADVMEQYWTLTDPENSDTDGDGLLDGEELQTNVTTNPLAYDTDGDGVGDGDEVASGASPRQGDSDHDGLSDAQELGTMTALSEDDFMWFELSGGTNLLSGETVVDTKNWKNPLGISATINNTCYTNVRVCADGTIYLLCPTNNSNGVTHNFRANLADLSWSDVNMTIAVCSANLYARTDTWGSQIICDTVTVNEHRYDVIEYRNMGLFASRNEEELITCQVILPEDEPNTIYMSYLCASNAFRFVDMAVGIQCGWMRSWKTGEQYYNLSWPINADFPVDGLTIKYYVGTGTSPVNSDTDGDGLPDSEEVLCYNSNPLAVDTDGDGLLDGNETLLGLNPISGDSDCDGMPDGWELASGLNPLADDADDDLDPVANGFGDGLSNWNEYVLGTNPLNADTDGDGLLDGEECGWWEYVDSLPIFNMAGATNLLQSSFNYDNDRLVVRLPFTFKCAGYTHTNLTICVDGLIGLMSDRDASSFLSHGDNCALLAYGTDSSYTTIAAYWDDLYAKANGASQIKMADMTVGESRYAVIEYSNMQRKEQKDDASVTGSFQIVIPQGEPNTVYVRYFDLSSAFNGASATVGAQLPQYEKAFQVCFNNPGAITNGMIIAFHLGAGSNPQLQDSDGDGLGDAIEILAGTSARFVDTDLDGLPDGWEYSHGLAPLSAIGDNGPDGDMDGDGLKNLVEYLIGTNPSSSHTDGDLLLDGGETGLLNVSTNSTWLAMPANVQDLTPFLPIQIWHASIICWKLLLLSMERR